MIRPSLKSNVAIAHARPGEPFSETGAPAGRAALLIAHPGHELVVHAWLEKAKPEVFVLTDGSGRVGVSRLHSSSKLLESTGATPGGIYGRYSEAAIYRALLVHDTDLFVSLAEELAHSLIQGSFDYVAGDMAEGFNPVHDAWRMVIDAAVAMVKLRTSKEILNYDFSLFRRQDGFDVPGQSGAKMCLDAVAFTKKLTAAQSYPELLPEVVAAIFGKLDDPIFGHPAIRVEVQALLCNLGPEAFRTEYFRLLQDGQEQKSSGAQDEPFYEVYGERLVAEGRYDVVLRHRAHMLPVAEALAKLVLKTDSSPAPFENQGDSVFRPQDK